MTDGNTYTVNPATSTFHVFSLDPTSYLGGVRAARGSDHGDILSRYVADPSSPQFNRFAVMDDNLMPTTRIFRVEDNRTRLVEEVA